MAEIAALNKYPCAACGAEANWDPRQQSLVCPYCGTVAAVDFGSADSPIPEHDLLAALGQITRDPNRPDPEARISVQCQSCKAVSRFDPSRVAQRCDFCGSPAIVPYTATDRTIHPGSLLPFRVSESEVRESIRRWYGSRWFAPNRLKRGAMTDTVRGVYIPYWTFDAKVRADWTAESGYYYWVSQSYTDAQGRRQTRRVRKIRWRPSSGSMDHFFDDELVPGTRGIDHALLRKIEPFPTHELLPYDAAYVSGWVVEQYQIDLPSAASHSRQIMEQKVRALCAREVPGDTHRGLQVQSNYSEQTFKHILAPIWLLSYNYGSQTFQVLVNGFTGKIAGKHPLSWIKITLAILAILLVLAIILLFAGQK
jgi:predicted RNA-binding Zn-ribbon protein involved in translation (DUF1610 family)